MSTADWRRFIPLFSSVAGNELDEHGTVLVALGNAAAVTSENRGLFHTLQQISASAPWSASSCTSCSTSNPRVPSAISFSHFLCLSSIFCLFLSCFPWGATNLADGLSCAHCSRSIVVVSGTEHVLVSSHGSQQLVMDTQHWGKVSRAGRAK